MREAWIGRCHLRARNTERQRWIGNREEAVGRLMLIASSAEDFETGLRNALPPMGYDLVAVISATPVAQTDDLGDAASRLPSLLPHVGRSRPVPLGGFFEVEPPSPWEETTWDALCSGRIPLWAVVDGVNWPEISMLLGRGDAEHSCLYSTLNPESRALAPWLVRLKPGSAITAAIRRRPQETHSLILLQSEHAMPELRRHLRHFTMLQTPADPEAPVYFRFYDPRVMIDAMESMRPAFAARFMDLFSSIAVPVSPYCLLPAGITMTGSEIGPFDPDDSCQGRLLRWALPEDIAINPANTLQVSETEFVTLSERMERRAARKLARRLYRDHGDAASQQQCVAAADAAKSVAARFGMATVKQVAIIASCLLIFGEDFYIRHPEAGSVLNDKSLLPWQKKDHLMKWFIQAYLQSDLARSGRGV